MPITGRDHEHTQGHTVSTHSALIIFENKNRSYYFPMVGNNKKAFDLANLIALSSDLISSLHEVF